MANTKTSTYIFLKGKLKKCIAQLFGNKQYEKLVILGRQRTGSSLLKTLLHAHPKIDIEGEVFRLLEGKSCRTVWKETFSKKLPWIKYAGFKLFYNHPDDSEDREVWEILNADTNVKVIHIKRENILRTYISKLIALKTGAWNSRQEEEKTEFLDKRVKVDVEHCLNELREIKKLEAQFGKTRFPNHPYIELSFEELTQDKEGQLSRIYSFLGLEYEKIEKTKINLKRQNPEGLRELILNYDDLVEKISHSEFKNLLS
ncbi:sulfotransferase [uncultured Eudoraea sp.]|uniref:sulfotransferase family protein n=1 Tax=uncultured Eudoraea sp. TaxID=1035614 RepID=UPI0026026348|nr:sulfotransferase [uncultured Eudoraea sp.]